MNYISFDIYPWLEENASLSPNALAFLQQQLVQMNPRDIEHQLASPSMSRINGKQKPDCRYLIQMIRYALNPQMMDAPFYFRVLCDYFQVSEPPLGIAIERDGTMNLHHLTRFYEPQENMNLTAQRLFLHHPQWKSLANYFGEHVIDECNTIFYLFRDEFASTQQWTHQDNLQTAMTLPTIDNDISFRHSELVQYPLGYLIHDFQQASESKWHDLCSTIQGMSPHNQQMLWNRIIQGVQHVKMTAPFNRLIKSTVMHLPAQLLLKHPTAFDLLAECGFVDALAWRSSLEHMALVDPDGTLQKNTLEYQESTLYLT